MFRAHNVCKRFIQYSVGEDGLISRMTSTLLSTTHYLIELMDSNIPELPLIERKAYQQPSVFRPENLLREARRQKGLPRREVPPICILDPDGDMVRQLTATGGARKSSDWPGYHTDLHIFDHRRRTYGILGCAVGSSFAVLVTEQLFAAGCDLLISVTSAGQILPKGAPPYFVLIDRALRDEGTSYHYEPPARWAAIDSSLLEMLEEAFEDVSVPVYRGASWTTDAPFRETEEAIERARDEGILAVEMEAAALYTFARSRSQAVLCLAHVTNQMAQIEGDFEKGADDGSAASLEIIHRVAEKWQEK